MKTGGTHTTASRGVVVTKLADDLWRTDPKFAPGKKTIVLFSRAFNEYLGPKWAIEAVLEAEAATEAT